MACYFRNPYFWMRWERRRGTYCPIREGTQGATCTSYETRNKLVFSQRINLNNCLAIFQYGWAKPVDFQFPCFDGCQHIRHWRGKSVTFSKSIPGNVIKCMWSLSSQSKHRCMFCCQEFFPFCFSLSQTLDEGFQEQFLKKRFAISEAVHSELFNKNLWHHRFDVNCDISAARCLWTKQNNSKWFSFGLCQGWDRFMSRELTCLRFIGVFPGLFVTCEYPVPKLTSVLRMDNTFRWSNMCRFSPPKVLTQKGNC